MLAVVVVALVVDVDVVVDVVEVVEVVDVVEVVVDFVPQDANIIDIAIRQHKIKPISFLPMLPPYLITFFIFNRSINIFE